MWRRKWESFRDIGVEAHIDSVTKCDAHMYNAEHAKRDEAAESWRQAQWADELAREGAREVTFQAALCDMYNAAVKTSRASISNIGSFILQAKGGERWTDVAAPHQDWGEKDERWERLVPTLARPHKLTRNGRQWSCDACSRHASDGAAKAKLARTECVEHPAGHSVISLLSGEVLCGCCRCGAAAAKFAKKLGEPCVEQLRSQEYARSIPLLSSGWHPKDNRFHGSPKLFTLQAWARWRPSVQETTAIKLGWPSPGEHWSSSALQKRRAAPSDRKYFLLKTGEIKWCWRCGAR